MSFKKPYTIKNAMSSSKSRLLQNLGSQIQSLLLWHNQNNAQWKQLSGGTNSSPEQSSTVETRQWWTDL